MGVARGRMEIVSMLRVYLQCIGAMMASEPFTRHRPHCPAIEYDNVTIALALGPDYIFCSLLRM